MPFGMNKIWDQHQYSLFLLFRRLTLKQAYKKAQNKYLFHSFTRLCPQPLTTLLVRPNATTFLASGWLVFFEKISTNEHEVIRKKTGAQDKT